jgi:hypothetical protein
LVAATGREPRSISEVRRQNPKQTLVIETEPIRTERVADFDAGDSDFALESCSFVFARFISLKILRTKIRRQTSNPFC